MSRCYLREAEKDSSGKVESFALRMNSRCHNFGSAQVLDTLSVDKSRNDHARSYYPHTPVCYTWPCRSFQEGQMHCDWHRMEFTLPWYFLVVDPIDHEMNTLRILLSSHSSPISPSFVGSLYMPFFVPSFSFNSCNLSLPKTRPFGKTTGSSSIALVVWCA